MWPDGTPAILLLFHNTILQCDSHTECVTKCMYCASSPPPNKLKSHVVRHGYSSVYHVFCDIASIVYSGLENAEASNSRRTDEILGQLLHSHCRLRLKQKGKHSKVIRLLGLRAQDMGCFWTTTTTTEKMWEDISETDSDTLQSCDFSSMKFIGYLRTATGFCMFQQELLQTTDKF